MSAASIVVVKSMPYRGTTEEWSNRYHFDSGPPASQALWLAFANAITAAEKLILIPTVKIIRVSGYQDDEHPAQYTGLYNLPGTFATGGTTVAPGDAACWIRYSTGRADARGHPVYLRNYYHGVFSTDAANPDNVVGSWRTAASTYAAAWIAGFSDGSVTHKRTGPDSLGATGHLVATYIGRRRLKRRG